MRSRAEHAPTRRAWLRRLGAGAAAWPLVGCTLRHEHSIAAKTGAGAVAATEFAQLQAGLQGQVLVPADAAFAAAARTFHHRFDAVVPRAIAGCVSVADVQATIAFAKAAKIPLRIRAGGHSYAGYNKAANALVLDVRPLHEVVVDSAAGTVSAGAGATLIDVQAKLWPLGLALPTGSCPTVGIAGLTLGGGYGLIAREFGMTCDVLRRVELVLASGEHVVASADSHPDLFWASRGGGGGNFGVATTFVFDVRPMATASTFGLRWPWAKAAAVVDAWQRWAPAAPDALTATCHLLAGGAGGAAPSIRVGGGFLGGKAALLALVADLAALGAGAPAEQDVATGAYADIARGWVDCDAVLAHCRLADDGGDGQVERGTYLARSDYVASALPPAAIAVLLKAMESRVAAPAPAMVLLDPYGGAIGRVAADATAFVHREALFGCQYLVFGSKLAPAQPGDPWLSALYDAMRPYVSGSAYQNYADAALGSGATAYYGANLKRLQAVKQAYDPERLFDFPQAI